MYWNSSQVVLRAALALAALLAPTVYGQTTATCNGLSATIVGTAPGPIIGTEGDDVIVGSAGDDQILGLGGTDTICGLGGNDQITGGRGDDRLFGQAGNDTFIWAPGDGSDRIEGSTDSDTLQMANSGANEVLDLSANGSRLRLTRNIANIALDVAGVEDVTLEARGGADLIVVNRLVGTGIAQVTLDLESLENSNTPDGQPDSIILFGSTRDDSIAIAGSGSNVRITGAGPAIEIRNPEALDSVSIDGMAGNDKITGQGLAPGVLRLTLQGGTGNDTLTGSQGYDVLAGGDDDDTFVWALGSPADLVGGEAGIDTLRVMGSASADNVTLTPTLFGVQVGNNDDGVVFQADVEQAVLQAGRGADRIFVNTMAGTALQNIILDLRPTPTGILGDGAEDALVVNGTAAADNIGIAGGAGSLTISGLAPTILVQGSEGVRDMLTINGGPETDVLDAHGLAADVIRLVLRGGFANDIVTGSAADDLFAWSPGDGSDIIEGGAGNDTLRIDGSNVSENVSLTANGPRLRFSRDVASIVLDVNAVERVTYAAQGGPDTISIGDLNGTSVKQVAIDLSTITNSAGDGQPDTIQITTVTGNRPITTAIGSGTMTVTWSPVNISVTGVEPTNDRLILQTPTGSAPATISSALQPKITTEDEAAVVRR